jgi:hypothetical protein
MLLSIVAHVVAIVLIASITFRYPIARFFDANSLIHQEHVEYVRVQPAPAVRRGNGVAGNAAPRKKKTENVPAPIVAPAEIPTTLPTIPVPSAGTTANSAGTSGGTGGSPNGIATGIEPALPDARIGLRPNNLHLPLTQGQRNDSAVKAIFLAYREAELEAEAHQGRDPRDWTFQHNGQKYGVDSQYIYLGRFKIPSAVLAALPLNFGGVDGERLIENRNADWIRDDIYSHSQGMSEDDFNAAVRRIRARKDKERKEAEEQKAKDAKAASAIVPQ